MHKWTADRIHNGEHFISEQVIVTEDDGTIVDFCSKQDAGSDLITHKGILCPGFINTHCHLELSYMKERIHEKTGLHSFLKHVILSGRDQDPCDEENIRERTLAMAAAEEEMIQQGIVAVGDISNTLFSLTQKEQRRLHYVTFIECMGLRSASADSIIEHGIAMRDQFKARGLPAMVVPHAPYSVSRKLFAHINQHNRGLISIHNQEDYDENRLYLGDPPGIYALLEALEIPFDQLEPTGKTSLRSYLPWFTHDQPLLLVHNVYTRLTEMAEVMHSGRTIYWCLCPNANWFIDEQVPPVEALRSLFARITLGTDSLASNHQLSILSEMQCLQKHFPKMPLEEMLRWATANGADALDCDHLFGRLQKGKSPGLLLLENLSADQQTLLPETSVQRLC